MATIVFFHAHPDDEAIATGGTMARLAEEGHRVVLVTATGGELGLLPADGLGDGETLAQRRAAELAEACRLLGVDRHVNLGYLDSGMAGEPSNEDPAAFCQADRDEAAGRLAAVLAAEGAEALTVYDEHGGYGHPDHIQVHRVGVAAAAVAAVPRVYMATLNRDHMQALMVSDAAQEFDPGERAEEIDTLGVEAARITTFVDVRPWLATKRAAMAAHASQIDETSFFLAMPDEVFAMVWGTEWYVRVGADPAAGGESHLVDGAPAAT